MCKEGKGQSQLKLGICVSNVKLTKEELSDDGADVCAGFEEAF